MKGPPRFVAGNCVPGGGVVGDEADSSLLAALARRNGKDFVFVLGVVCRSAEIMTVSKSQNPRPVSAKDAETRVGHPRVT